LKGMIVNKKIIIIIIILISSNCIAMTDIYEDDDNINTATLILLKPRIANNVGELEIQSSSQIHSFNNSTDEDWIKLYLENTYLDSGGYKISLAYLNYSESFSQGFSISFYNKDGTPFVNEGFWSHFKFYNWQYQFEIDALGKPTGEVLLNPNSSSRWNINYPTLGKVYMKIRPLQYIENSDLSSKTYELTVRELTSGDFAPPDYVYGMVADSINTSKGIANATITSISGPEKINEVSYESGLFLMYAKSGFYTVNISAEGYYPSIQSFELTESLIGKRLDFTLTAITPPSIEFVDINDTKKTKVDALTYPLQLYQSGEGNIVTASDSARSYQFNPLNEQKSTTKVTGIFTTEDGHIQLVLEGGIIVNLMTDLQEEDAFTYILERMGFKMEQDNKSIIQSGEHSHGLIRVSAKDTTTDSNQAWYAIRPAYASTKVEFSESHFGLSTVPAEGIKNLSLYRHIFYEDKLLEQILYPMAANWDVLKQYLNSQPNLTTQANINEKGDVVVGYNHVSYKFKMDYRIEKTATETGRTSLINISDMNGDGTDDWKVIYPNGQTQIMYLYP